MTSDDLPHHLSASDGLPHQVRQLPRSDSRSLTFRIDAILEGVSARQVEHCFSPEVYSLWNRDVHSAAFLYAPTTVQGSSPRSRAEGGDASPRGSTMSEVDLNCSCTYPVLGGMISGRGFIDVRAVSVSVADGNDPLETHYSAQQALPAHLFGSAPAAQRWAALAAADKLLLARNLPGGGQFLRPGKAARYPHRDLFARRADHA